MSISPTPEQPATRAPGRTRPTGPLRLAWPPVLVDLVLVVLFAGLGRANHHEGGPVLGTLAVAAPFLAGMAIGHLLVALTRHRAAWALLDGVPVWLCAVVWGMLLRLATGQGAAWSFVAVATLVLGGFLLGWRALVALVGPRRAAS